ncbi:MAG: serine protease [Marinicella sp.]
MKKRVQAIRITFYAGIIKFKREVIMRKFKFMVCMLLVSFQSLSGIQVLTQEEKEKRIKNALVKINAPSSDGNPDYEFNAFFISSDGLIATYELTSMQLWYLRNELRLTFPNGIKIPLNYIAEISEIGITLLKADVVVENVLTLSNHQPEINSEQTIMGIDTNNEIVKRTIKIRSIENNDLKYSREKLMPGLLGSPIINANGEVIGIHVGGSEKIGDGLKLSEVKDYLSKLKIILIR